MSLNWHTEKIPLNKFGADSAIAPVSATTTFYGSEADYKRRVLAGKFYSQGAITGLGTAMYTIGLYAGSTKIAELTFTTGTDHVANDYTDLTMEAANAADTTAIISADVTLTCSALKTGSPGNLHTNSWVCVTMAPVELF